MSNDPLRRVTIQVDDSGTQIVGILVQKTISETIITVESHEKSEQKRSHHFESFEIIPEKIIINGEETIVTDIMMASFNSVIKKPKKLPDSFLQEMYEQINREQYKNKGKNDCGRDLWSEFDPELESNKKGSK
jgi:hypothetical protein